MARTVICMIPARLGSQRVPKKNLRLIGGKPLISWAVEAAIASEAFDGIYINSEAEIFAEIARLHGVSFYRRPEHLASNAAVNDEFAYDFIRNVPGDVLVQLLPTSPLITGAEIADFVDTMERTGVQTLVSIEDHRIACVRDGEPVNFSVMEPHRPSQAMTPVGSYATVLMGWEYERFAKDMAEHGFAYHGGTGTIGYFPIAGLSTIDIDDEEDFELAEVAMAWRKASGHGAQGGGRAEPEYFEPGSGGRTEVDVPAILATDGVLTSDFANENLRRANLFEIIGSADDTRSWCRRIINTENNSATLISQLPGEGNRTHYHPDWNEWWYIVKGRWRWEIGDEVYELEPGDLVLNPKGELHRIVAVGDGPAVRLAVSKDLMPHVYPADVEKGGDAS